MEPSPSTLFVFWPWDEPPTQVEVDLRFEPFAEPVDGEPETDAGPEVLWTASYRSKESLTPILVWVTPLDHLPEPEEFSEARWAKGEMDRATRSRWAVGVETLLSPAIPLKSYHRQLRACMELCPDTPAIYDSCSYTLRSGTEVARLTNIEIPPRTKELYRIHAVAPEAGDAPGWLHTHGLRRACFPEVDLLAVPRDLWDAGAHLINSFVDHFLGDTPPAAGTPFEVGYNLRIAWVAWQDAVRGLPRGLPGGVEDREGEDNEHAGARVALVGARRRGWLRKRWRLPIDVLETIHREGAVAGVSKHETKRMALLARERWAHFGMLFVRHRQSRDWRFVVKLGYSIDEGQPGDREHLWFEVQEIAPNRIRAQLLNRPVGISRMREGQEDWHTLDKLTDWRIYTSGEEFTPENVEILEEE